MSIFVLKKIEEIVGKVEFYKLEKNGFCFFNEFCEEITKDGNHESELIKIQIIMDSIANNKLLPQNKYKKLDDSGNWEIKTRNLRVYLFHEKKTGKIIVLGGKKNSQKKDIVTFKNLKDQYLKSLQ